MQANHSRLKQSQFYAGDGTSRPRGSFHLLEEDLDKLKWGVLADWPNSFDCSEGKIDTLRNFVNIATVVKIYQTVTTISFVSLPN